MIPCLSPPTAGPVEIFYTTVLQNQKIFENQFAKDFLGPYLIFVNVGAPPHY